MSETIFSDKLVDRLARARSVAVLTGAGISAESGIATFRDAGGLWQKYRPEDLATVGALVRNPSLVQEWYRHRRQIVNKTEPNPGHYALAALQKLIDDFTLVTQNVDGLHQRAGSTGVLELHGNLLRNYCIDCRTEADDDVLDAIAQGEAARCSGCNGYIRPDVVWFGEMLPVETFEAASRAALRADVFLSIGTSGVVYPAAGLPLQARDAGAYVAEINIEPSDIAGYLDEAVLGRAGVVLPALVEALAERKRAT